MEIEVHGPEAGLASACEPVLRSLPRWFGREEATARYLDDVDRLQTFTARRGVEVVGFLALKEHNPYAAEVYVMAVREGLHRRGVGSKLLAKAEAYSAERGAEYLHVKTLGPSHPDRSYAATRAFYAAAGFRPLEEFPALWGEGTPCLLMVKRLGR